MGYIATCENCKEEFETAWSGEEASVEFMQNFPGYDIKAADLVCDGCYQELMAEIKEQS